MARGETLASLVRLRWGRPSDESKADGESDIAALFTLPDNASIRGEVEQELGYGKHLALIHHEGFADWALNSAPALLAELEQAGILSGLVVELGCGSGILAQTLVERGYAAHGIDQSQAMIDLARRRVPSAEFTVGSIVDVPLPSCSAVFAVGEVFNYLFDERLGDSALPLLFGKVFQALNPGGVFVFDVAGPGRVQGGSSRGFKRSPNWAVLFDAAEEGNQLTRSITAFVKQGDRYERSDEVHRLTLLSPLRVASALLESGFKVRVSDRYASEPFAPGHAVFFAKKDR